MPPNVEMIYSDIGDEVISGRRLSTCTDERNPCRAALEDQQGWGNGRCSWDPIVVLKSIRPDSSDYSSEAGGYFKEVIAICSPNYFQIWKGIDQKMVFCRVRHKNCQAKGEIFLCQTL